MRGGTVVWRASLDAKEPSGSSSDEGGFLREGAEAEGGADAGHTLPVRNSRSVRNARDRTPLTAESTHELYASRSCEKRELFVA